MAWSYWLCLAASSAGGTTGPASPDASRSGLQDESALLASLEEAALIEAVAAFVARGH